MRKLAIILLLATLVALMAGTFPRSVRASDCVGVYFRNDSTTALDEAAICEAASPLVGHGLQVYVYLTDYSPTSEGDWFSTLDQVEMALGLRREDGFFNNENAFILEATTSTSQPWGWNITFGDTLINSPLEARKSEVSGTLKNGILSGDVALGYISALKLTNQIAFPVVQPQQPVAPAQPPVIIQETREPVNLTPVINGIGLLLVVIVVGGGLFVIVTKWFLPWQSSQQRLTSKRAYLNSLREKVEQLTLSLDGILGGQTDEDTLIWDTFVQFQIEKYPDLRKEVKALISSARDGLNAAFEFNEEIHKIESDTEEHVDEMAEAYERVYANLIGTDPIIASMSEAAMSGFVDPLNLGTNVGRLGGEIRQRIDQARLGITGSSFLIQYRYLQTDELVNIEGVYEIANKLKTILVRLITAQTQSQVLLDKAKEKRSDLSRGDFFPELSPDKIFREVDALITSTEAESKKQLWLTALEAITKATAILGFIQVELPEANDSIRDYISRTAKTREIVNAGFRLSELLADLKICMDITEQMAQRLSEGDEAVKRSITNLDDASIAMLYKATELVALRDKNVERLTSMSSEVARVQRYLDFQAQSAWAAIKGRYPAPNYNDIEDNVSDSSDTLSKLFDNPADENDLSSKIAKANSLQIQDFKQTEGLLDQAFASLVEAEAQLKEVVDRLELLNRLEADNAQTNLVVLKEIEKAKARRAENDQMVDTEVDQLIELAEGEYGKAATSSSARDFLAADKMFQAARESALNAYGSADKQIQAILALQTSLTQLGQEASSLVNQAIEGRHSLIPAALTNNAASLCDEAQTALRKAEASKSEANKKEDRQWAAALQRSVNLFNEVIRTAKAALSQLNSDWHVYDGYVSSAREAIENAERAIASASTRVSDSDASGAGAASLNQARNMLPGLPAVGASIDELRRIESSASEAERLAQQARQQANARIQAVEAEREERRRQEAAERRRQEEAAASARRAAESARRMSSSFSSHSRSSSGGFSSRSSSSGFSSRSMSSGRSSRG